VKEERNQERDEMKVKRGEEKVKSRGRRRR
jgi:hypothetical protein